MVKLPEAPKIAQMPPLTGDPSSYPVSDFSDGMGGTCLCGSITVKITQQGLFDQPNGHTCHCSNCRKSSGAATTNILKVPASNASVSDPHKYLKTYVDTNTGTGDALPRSFCSNCGSSIGNFVGEESKSPWAFVALGLFPRMPVPEFELFTAHRQEWVKPVEGAKQHDFLRQRK